MTGRPIAIIGPTGTGKSDLAVEIAVRIGGEVVNADAVKVTTIGEGVNVAIYRATLRAFCEKHGLAFAEPRWLIVSDVS